MGEPDGQRKPIDLFELNHRLRAAKESLPAPTNDPLAELARIVDRDGCVVAADTDRNEEVWADDRSSAQAPAAKPPKPGFKTSQHKRHSMSASFYASALAGLIAIILAAYLVWPGRSALSLLGQHADTAIVTEAPDVAAISAPAITLNSAAAIVAPAHAAGGATLSSISEQVTSSAFTTLRDQTLARLPVATVPPAITVDPVSAEPTPIVSAPSPPEIPADEQEQMLLRAGTMLQQGDIAGARTVFARLDRLGNGPASFALAQTYDPVMLKQWNVVGIEPDPNKAVQFYRRALDEGISAAQEHLTASVSLGR